MYSENQQQINSRFLPDEYLQDLRTEREIAQNCGEPWTRELPPPPVLPPYGPLQKISGRLESFRKEYFREYFGVKAYRSSPLPEVTTGQRGAGAAAAIAAGSPGMASVIMTDSESQNSSAEYVQGSINGKPFRGWVGITRLQVGDEVEMAVEWQHDHYQVYAIALPEERIISVCPECDMGRIAHAFWRIKNMLVLTICLMFLIFCVSVVYYFFNDRQNGVGYWDKNSGALFFMLGGALVFTGLIAFFAWKAYAPTICKLAEEIYSLFGMEKVAWINLNKVTKKRERQLQAQGKWHDPGDNTRPVCPSQKFIYGSEYWFYY
ncbi:putative type VI secretion system effector [Jejubacter sp. L23]|uniref:putative type VI secretion system effector n=1 Tax=Jejubacter sp. L23 TaxID=3092086 RepID=UPI003D70E1B1